VNAVLRHGPTCEKDYRAIAPPIPYDVVKAKTIWQKSNYSNKTVA